MISESGLTDDDDDGSQSNYREPLIATLSFYSENIRTIQVHLTEYID